MELSQTNYLRGSRCIHYPSKHRGPVKAFYLYTSMIWYLVDSANCSTNKNQNKIKIKLSSFFHSEPATSIKLAVI